MASDGENRLREYILMLHRSGVPSGHIARRLGIPHNLVNYILKSELREVRR